MAFNHEYPYTDPNRYNDDWLLNRVQESETLINELIEQYAKVEDVIAQVNGYTDEQIAIVKNMIASNTSAIQEANTRLNSRIDALAAKERSDIDELTQNVEIKYVRNQQAIAQQWEDMKEYIANQVIDVKVRNFFTGAMVSLQSMFDYLSGLHLENAGTYAQASNQNTYNHFAAKNQTYTYVIMNSLTFFQS